MIFFKTFRAPAFAGAANRQCGKAFRGASGKNPLFAWEPLPFSEKPQEVQDAPSKK